MADARRRRCRLAIAMGALPLEWLTHDCDHAKVAHHEAWERLDLERVEVACSPSASALTCRSKGVGGWKLSERGRDDFHPERSGLVDEGYSIGQATPEKRGLTGCSVRSLPIVRACGLWRGWFALLRPARPFPIPVGE